MFFVLMLAPTYLEIFMEKCFEASLPDQLSHYLDGSIVPADTIHEMLD